MSVFTNAADRAAGGAEAYVNAVLDLLGDADPLTVLHTTPRELRAVLVGRSAEALAAPEAPGKWSAVQVLQHLADSELVWAYRMRMILGHDRPTITGFDQDAWATGLRYGEVRASEAYAEFANGRQGNLRLLKRLTDEEMARVGLHVERGEESLAHLVKLYAGHDLVHLRQLRRILGVEG